MDDRSKLPLSVATEWRPLGRYPNSLGDYSIDGFEGRCHVERKSIEDCCSTVLGWSKNNAGTMRRDQFKRELENLSAIKAGLVVVEGTFGQVIDSAPSRGKRSAQENAKTIMRTILAWMQDYKVPWLFCDGRRLAEVSTFRFLERYWRHAVEDRKEIERMVAGL